MSITLLLLPLHLGLPVALAVQPTDAVHVGKEPARQWTARPARQQALRLSADWQGFVAGEGQGWTARFDDWSGLPVRASGPGIAVSTASPAAVAADVSALLQRHAGLTGVGAKSLIVREAHHIADRDMWVVQLDQVVDGAVFPQGEDPSLSPDDGDFGHFSRHGQPVVWRGGVQAIVQNGRLVSFSVKSIPEWSGERVLSAADAVAVATSEGPAADRAHTVLGAALTVVPLSNVGDPQARLAWMVRSTTGGDHPGDFVSLVDAESGSLINVHNRVRYLSGTLSAEHDTRTVDGNMSVSPLVDLTIEDEAGAATDTDRSGGYTLAGSEGNAALYNGVFFDVRDNGSRSRSGSLVWSESDPVWTDSDASQAELDTYVFLTMVQQWAEVHAADIGIIEDGMPGNVNLSSSCNAYFDPSEVTVNFYGAGSGCNNTGRIKDVIFHEWGHGMHMYAARTGWVDGSVGEGSADVVAMLETNDSVMAPHFQTSGSGIRDAAPNLRYPEDIVGEVHQDGLIFAGAAWDYLKILEADLGLEAAQAIVGTQLVDALQTNPEIPDGYDAFLLADDDDGDPSNGTPHQCALLEAFGAHGLGPIGAGGSFLTLVHEPIASASSALDSYPVLAEVDFIADDCVDDGATGGAVYYRLAGTDSWDSVSLTIDGSDVEGAIPAQDPGAVVEYYLEIDSATGATMAPVGGPITPLSFVVGDLEEIRCFDFESDDGGFWSELVSGSSALGADDWMWGEPRGYADDPSYAASGDMVWGNDLGGRIDGEDWNGEYQNEKHNRLNSPEISLEGYENVVLQYRRWLRIEDGYYDQANILANGDQVWTNHASGRSTGDEHHLEQQWALHTVALPEAEAVTLSWEIISDSNLSFGGWNIDDVCLYGVVASPDDGGDEGGDDGEVTDEPDDVVGGGDDGGGDGADDLDGDDGNGKATACASASSAPQSGFLAMAGLMALGLVRRRRR